VDCSNPALPFFNEQTQGLLDSRVMFAESGDGGCTWSPPVLMDTSPFNMPTPITGPVLLLPDGEWVCQFETNKPYFDTTPWVHSSVLMFSRDGGRTWPRHAVVTRDPRVFYWDQRPQVLPDDRILDLFWTYDNQTSSYLNIHACESADGGRTWSALRDTGVPGQPAPVAPLRSGRLAMVYVDRTGAPAIRCRLSTDDGLAWPEDTVFSIYESPLPSQTVRKDGMADAWSEMGKFSVGLPATAALPDGDFLVVYYAGLSTDRTNVEWARLRPDSSH
jgi:predicted neuraminidase